MVFRGALPPQVTDAIITKKFKIYQTKVPNLKKKTKKVFPGQILGLDRLDVNSAKCLIRSGEIPSPRQTSIYKNNDCVVKSERDALVRGSDPPSRSVHNMADDAWRAPARRLIQ